VEKGPVGRGGVNVNLELGENVVVKRPHEISSNPGSLSLRNVKKGINFRRDGTGTANLGGKAKKPIVGKVVEKPSWVVGGDQSRAGFGEAW